MGKERLLDSWTELGNDIELFKKILKEMSSTTSVKKTEARNVTLYSKNENAITTEEKVPVYVLTPGKIWDLDEKTKQIMLHSGNINRKQLVDYGAGDLVDEYERRTKTMLCIDGKVYFTSSNLPSTMGLRTDIKGEAGIVPTLERDILSAQRLNTCDEISFITRTIDGLRKSFAALSGSYAYVPQSFLGDIITRIEADGKLGKMVCNNWSINNIVSEIYLEFPEKAAEISALYEFEDEIVPGLYLAKSDVGECSITIRATWRINNSIIVADELKRKHTGKIISKNILEDVDKIVFSKYTKIPELLCSLMGTDITNPTWAKTVSSKEFNSLNSKAIAEAIKHVFNEIGMVSAVGKKTEKSIYEQLCSEVDPALSYTAYDIVTMVMQLPERLTGLTTNSKNMLAKACGQAPFVDMTKKTKASKVVLTA